MTAGIDLGTLRHALQSDDLLLAIGEVAKLAAVLNAHLQVCTATPPQSVSTVEPYVTQQDAAAQLGIALSYMRRLTRTDRVPSLRRGKAKLVRVGEVATYLDTLRSRPLAQPVLRRVTSRP